MFSEVEVECMFAVHDIPNVAKLRQTWQTKNSFYVMMD
eukprot:gene18072-5713_t